MFPACCDCDYVLLDSAGVIFGTLCILGVTVFVLLIVEGRFFDWRDLLLIFLLWCQVGFVGFCLLCLPFSFFFSLFILPLLYYGLGLDALSKQSSIFYFSPGLFLILLSLARSNIFLLCHFLCDVLSLFFF